MSPLEVPEILDQCLGHLLDHPDALLASALVRRSWTFPAQSNLFWHVLLADYFGGPKVDLDRRCTLLLASLRASSHLSSLIRSFELSTECLSPKNLTALVSTSLPRLHTLYLAYTWPSELAAKGMRQLLSCPTLKHVQIRCSSGDSPDIFQSLFESLSPGVTRMEFFPVGMVPLVPETPTLVYRGAPLRIESFRFTAAYRRGVLWLESATGRYLDFTHLLRLSMGVYYHYLQAPLFLAAARTIEVLKFDTNKDTGIVDISSYTCVKTLCVSCKTDRDLRTVSRIIQSIPRSSCLIQKLCISGPLSDSGIADMRDHLAATYPALLDVLEMQYIKPVDVRERAASIPEHFIRNPSGRYTLGNDF
ncbi:hypothetical protein FB45DRAFT_1052880 [Roridomyces roridus]|uniref:F-box domain-containing protein n=1 Tax=Roridomyces roridus TaxID=1738132 RepID=A0AAD7FUI2_9AGAR|nr:hypothetical protein FB45DRAFT_1052880 [Roridomyces roridus]